MLFVMGKRNTDTLKKNSALERAVEAVGGQASLARLVTKLGRKCTQAHVWNWLNRDLKVPGEYVLPIESVTGVSRHELRPDLYPIEAVTQ